MKVYNMTIQSWVFLILVVSSCTNNTLPDKLPIIGHRTYVDGDTIYPVVRPYEFINQDSALVNNATFEDGIYVVDFFFTSCPTICPKIKQQMLRIYEAYADEDRLKLCSFTVDPRRDHVARLREYAQKLEVSTPRWHFVTGEKDSLHSISGDFMSIALENPDAPGGFDHSGRLILVDQSGYVRAFCNGTEPEEVTEFMKKIDILLNEA